MHATFEWSNLEKASELEDMVIDLGCNVDDSLAGFDSSPEDDKWHENDTPAHDIDNNLALDTGVLFISTKNKKVVTNVKKVDCPTLICANTGERRIYEVSKKIGMDDKAWADEESKANVNCFKDIQATSNHL